MPPVGEILRAIFCYFSVNSIDFLDIREYNIKRILDIRELEVSHVARAKFQTLTEQMFYTLLCLKDEKYVFQVACRVAFQLVGKIVGEIRDFFLAGIGNNGATGDCLRNIVFVKIVAGELKVLHVLVGHGH